MTQDVDAIVKEALAAFAGLDDAGELEQAKARYLGRAGSLTQLLKGLAKVPAAERPAVRPVARSAVRLTVRPADSWRSCLFSAPAARRWQMRSSRYSLTPSPPIWPQRRTSRTFGPATASEA